MTCKSAMSKEAGKLLANNSVCEILWFAECRAKTGDNQSNKALNAIKDLFIHPISLAKFPKELEGNAEIEEAFLKQKLTIYSNGFVLIKS